MSGERRRPDVTIENQRGLFLLRPQTDAGRAWLEANVRAEKWQWIDGALAIDGQEYMQPIVVAMIDAGLQLTNVQPGTTDNGETVH